MPACTILPKATGEQDFMRCLPDSLDIVTLTNADNFSKFDAEDMSVMHEKGTKVLYQIDYAARAEEFADAAALDAYLDKVVVAVAANGMDGYSFTTDPLAADATARIIDRLATARTDGQLLVFEVIPCRSLPPTVQRWITSSSIRRNSKMFWM